MVGLSADSVGSFWIHSARGFHFSAPSTASSNNNNNNDSSNKRNTQKKRRTHAQAFGGTQARTRESALRPNVRARRADENSGIMVFAGGFEEEDYRQSCLRGRRFTSSERESQFQQFHQTSVFLSGEAPRSSESSELKASHATSKNINMAGESVVRAGERRPPHRAFHSCLCLGPFVCAAASALRCSPRKQGVARSADDVPNQALRRGDSIVPGALLLLSFCCEHHLIDISSR